MDASSGEARRLKLAFALFLCPACFVGFMGGTLGLGALAGLAWLASGPGLALLLVAAAVVVMVVSWRRPACPIDR